MKRVAAGAGQASALRPFRALKVRDGVSSPSPRAVIDRRDRHGRATGLHIPGVIMRSSPLPGKRFWLVTPRDALEVVFEDGLFATRLELVVQGDSLVGNRHIYGDVPSSPPTVQPAAGVREPCPAGVAAAGL